MPLYWSSTSLLVPVGAQHPVKQVLVRLVCRTPSGVQAARVVAPHRQHAAAGAQHARGLRIEPRAVKPV
eukprot:CAMPEP_0202864426 /NCGR_PEP_ID=MMETSP1391-20130828/4671_1 /ASSEMBLY_ACC=CAM_ASM_000867 /TAXON_ID=1034604 /ORGANISM="Chlamydomonas leiostraca, Strain SAG 11-49" /LENGTH=68 /DNA_ID=CAMNT_0049544163 /DNA_START=616 /DNA_END=822 /DNA_ORIENTATION=+